MRSSSVGVFHRPPSPLVPFNTQPEIHNVLVFATPEDASHAMDVIEGDVFPTCWFNFWDREIAVDFPPTRRPLRHGTHRRSQRGDR